MISLARAADEPSSVRIGAAESWESGFVRDIRQSHQALGGEPNNGAVCMGIALTYCVVVKVVEGTVNGRERSRPKTNEDTRPCQ